MRQEDKSIDANVSICADEKGATKRARDEIEIYTLIENSDDEEVNKYCISSNSV